MDVDEGCGAHLGEHVVGVEGGVSCNGGVASTGG